MTEIETPEAPESFDGLGLADDVLATIEAAGYTRPTAVQAQGIPAMLTGGDIVFQAQTGTGKTAAFVLPIVQQLEAKPGTIEVLVLAPTRELAKQVCGEFAHFGGERGINATPIYGGTSFQKQFDALETAQVVVATPGRLLDLLRRRSFSTKNIRFFGLDEADELLSMGFEKDVLDVISHLPEERQSFLCSATINPAVHRVSGSFIKDATIVNVSSDEIGARSVKHEHFIVRPADKLEALRRLIKADASTGAIVFCNTRAATFMVYQALLAEGTKADVINGDLSQTEREHALARMREDKVDFLVATDVAARGIDISGLPAVINYDLPESPDIYIHRTGRTGRAGQAGVAYSFRSPSDISVFHALEKFYKLEFHIRELPSTDDIRAAVADDAIEGLLEGLDASGRLAYAQHLPLATRLHDRPDGGRLIAKLIAHWLETGGVAPVHEVDDDPAPVRERRKRGEFVGYEGDEDLVKPAEARPPKARPAAAAAAAEPEPGPATATETVQADEAPAPRRERKSRSRRDETSASNDSATTPPAPAREDDADLATTADADAVFTLLEKASRRRGRWRGSFSIAKELGVTEDAVEAVLADDERAEQSRKNPGQWRLTREARPPRENDSDRGERKSAPRAEAPRKSNARAPREAKASEDSAAPARKSRAPKAEPARNIPASPASKAEYISLGLNVGTDHGFDVDSLSAELVNLAGLDLEDLGKVRVDADSSKVDVLEDYWEDMANAVHGQTLNGQKLDVTRPRRRKKR